MLAYICLSTFSEASQFLSTVGPGDWRCAGIGYTPRVPALVAEDSRPGLCISAQLEICQMACILFLTLTHCQGRQCSKQNRQRLTWLICCSIHLKIGKFDY